MESEYGKKKTKPGPATFWVTTNLNKGSGLHSNPGGPNKKNGSANYDERTKAGKEVKKTHRSTKNRRKTVERKGKYVNPNTGKRLKIQTQENTGRAGQVNKDCLEKKKTCCGAKKLRHKIKRLLAVASKRGRHGGWGEHITVFKHLSKKKHSSKWGG